MATLSPTFSPAQVSSALQSQTFSRRFVYNLLLSRGKDCNEYRLKFEPWWIGLWTNFGVISWRDVARRLEWEAKSKPHPTIPDFLCVGVQQATNMLFWVPSAQDPKEKYGVLRLTTGELTCDCMKYRCWKNRMQKECPRLYEALGGKIFCHHTKAVEEFLLRRGKIAFTGPRKIDPREQTIIYRFLNGLQSEGKDWYVGDAEGLDDFVRRAHKYYRDEKNLGDLQRFFVSERERGNKYAYAKRSTAMIDAAKGGTLIAFPNKPCPEKCTPSTPFSGHGSGTWGTVAYAKKLGLEIQIVKLADIDLPTWLTSEQLSLL